ncbi:MAG: hypothetical protein ACREXY_15660 [Gammaproteobacteria bacterium]
MGQDEQLVTFAGIGAEVLCDAFLVLGNRRSVSVRWPILSMSRLVRYGSLADITSVIDNFDKEASLAPAFSFAD